MKKEFNNMPFFRNLPIQKKLVLLNLTTCLVALLLVSGAFVVYELITFRNTAIQKLSSLGEVIGANSASALLFNDTSSAQETLNTLKEQEEIVSVGIYTLDGEIFAKYIKKEAPMGCPPKPIEKGHRFQKGYLEMFLPIKVRGEEIGTLYLLSDMRLMKERLSRYSIIVIGMILFSSIFAYILASFSSRKISLPIIELSQASNRMAQEGLFDLNLKVYSKDEVGQLTDSFIKMTQKLKLFIQKEKELAIASATAAESKKRVKELEEAYKKLKETQEQLLQAQKMDAIGRLAGGVAHDFNNQLTAINGYAELLMESIEPNDARYQQIVEIKKASERSATLTRQLLAFSRRQMIELKVLNLNELLDNLQPMLEKLIGEHIELVNIKDPNLNMVKVDPSQIEHVLVNLSVNARDAMPKGGKLTFETKNVFLDKEYTQAHFWMRSGEYIMLSVMDTGMGMTEEVKKQIFEPFFTTKGKEKGTGLGLSTCYGIVKQSGGSVNVYSELGQGTSFRLYFPRVHETVEKLKQPKDKKQAELRGAETILLVEDEVSVRAIASEILNQKGYSIIEMEDGLQALEFVQKNQNTKIHLLLTDVIMPNMGGKDLADRIKEVFPDIKVLFMSGYTDESIVHHGVLEKGIQFIQKPFSAMKLASKIREVLDSQKAA